MQTSYPGGPWPAQQPPNPYNQDVYNQPRPTREKRKMNALLIPFIITVLLLLISAGFAAWAFTERNTYKNETDEIVAREVELARQETATAKDKEFVQKEKEPFRQYTSPSQFGSVTLTYPKTWSAYVVENDRGSTPVDGYLHPNFVPSTQSDAVYALRVQVVEQSYDVELERLESSVRNNRVQVSPYKAKNVPSVLGAKVVGEVKSGQKHTMVLFPLRDKTLKVWTESDQFVDDFEKIILPALVFAP